MNDQDDLRKALERLTTGQPANEVAVYYRNPFEVAREEWRERTYGIIKPGLRPEVKANWLTADMLKAPPPVFQVDQSDEQAFEEAMQFWRERSASNSL
jgi:hypothetical protein